MPKIYLKLEGNKAVEIEVEDFNPNDVNNIKFGFLSLGEVDRWTSAQKLAALHQINRRIFTVVDDTGKLIEIKQTEPDSVADKPLIQPVQTQDIFSNWEELDLKQLLELNAKLCGYLVKIQAKLKHLINARSSNREAA